MHSALIISNHTIIILNYVMTSYYNIISYTHCTRVKTGLKDGVQVEHISDSSNGGLPMPQHRYIKSYDVQC